MGQHRTVWLNSGGCSASAGYCPTLRYCGVGGGCWGATSGFTSERGARRARSATWRQRRTARLRDRCCCARGTGRWRGRVRRGPSHRMVTAETRFDLAWVRALCCCRTSVVVEAPSAYFFCSASSDWRARSTAAWAADSTLARFCCKRELRVANFDADFVFNLLQAHLGLAAVQAARGSGWPARCGCARGC